MPISPMRSIWFMPPVASLGPLRISTMFAANYEVTTSFAPSGTMIPPRCLTGWLGF